LYKQMIFYSSLTEQGLYYLKYSATSELKYS